MGKKDGTGKKRRREVDEESEEDAELEAEMQALMQMRAENDAVQAPNRAKSGDKAPRLISSRQDEEDDSGASGDEEVDNSASHIMRAQRMPGSRASNSQESKPYNRDGLLQSLESCGTEALPFAETLRVTEFEADVQDEHDDLQREVRHPKYIGRNR